MGNFLKFASALIGALLLGSSLVMAQFHGVDVAPAMPAMPAMPTIAAPIYQPSTDSRYDTPAIAAPVAQPACDYRNSNC